MKKRFKKRGIFVVEAVVTAAAVLSSVIAGYPAYAKFHSKDELSACMSNQRQIAASIQMYAQDHEETLPGSSTVYADIMVDPGVLQCPVDEKNINSYVYNNRISGKSIGDIDDPSTKFMTADGETVISKNRTLDNVYYSSADVQYRHNNQAVVSYLDGHTALTNKLIEKESWD